MKNKNLLFALISLLLLSVGSLQAQVITKSNSLEIQSSSSTPFNNVALRFTSETLTNYDFTLFGQEDFAISETNVGTRFYIQKGGNIGIGTTAPDQLLHIHKGSAGAVIANANSVAVFENDTSAYLSILHPAADESGLIFGNETDNPSGSIIFNRGNDGSITFNNGGDTPRMTIKGNGNVGIGETNPIFNLAVTSDSGAGTVLGLRNTSASGRFYSVLSTGADNDEGAGKLLFRDENVNAVRMAVDENGNVGIGLTNPDRKLSINGDMEFSDGTGGFSQGNIFNVDLLKGADDLRLAGSNNGSGDHLVINADGYVGIGADPITMAKLKVESTDASTDMKTATEFRSKYRGMASFVSNEGASEETFGILTSSTGGGNSYGGYLDGSGSTSGNNFGVYGRGDNSGSGNAYGVYGEVLGTGTRYAVYGKDNGVGGTAYAGFFEGRVAITDLPPGSGDYVVVDGSGNLMKSSASPSFNAQQIEDLQQENEALKARLVKLESMVQQLAPDSGKVDINSQTSTLTNARLEQNQPNPSSGSTVVRYFIPETVRQAELRVTDSAGKLLKSVAIQSRGEGQTAFDATTLSSGNYQYSLFLDGQLIDTKKMLLFRN